MGELLDKQYRYFVTHEETLRKKYAGQYIVIHNEEVAESFGSEKDAYIYCVQHFKIGTFYIQQIEEVS